MTRTTPSGDGANGNFVVTWSSNGQDGSGWGVYAQQYNSSGAKLGGEFRVNTTTTGDQTVSLRSATDGTAISSITWCSKSQDGSGWGVYAQRYSASGVPVGGEFRVNTVTAGDQEYASVSMNASGDFVITWSSNGRTLHGWGVYRSEL